MQTLQKGHSHEGKTIRGKEWGPLWRNGSSPIAETIQLKSMFYIWEEKLCVATCCQHSPSLLHQPHSSLSVQWETRENLILHVPVDLLVTPLILEPGLGQVNRKHTGYSNQASNATVDELGGQAIKTITTKSDPLLPQIWRGENALTQNGKNGKKKAYTHLSSY